MARTYGRRGLNMLACGRRAVGSFPSDQDQARVDGALCFTLASKNSQHKRRGPIAGQLGSREQFKRDTGPGNLDNLSNGRGRGF